MYLLFEIVNFLVKFGLFEDIVTVKKNNRGILENF
jgi:hypothetical protein